MVGWRFTRGVSEQYTAFIQGFNEIVSVKWLQYFDERELEVMLVGIQDIDIQDWNMHTIYRCVLVFVCLYLCVLIRTRLYNLLRILTVFLQELQTNGQTDTVVLDIY